MSKQFKVVRVPLAALVDNPDNANHMSDADYTALVAGIRTLGDMLQPILVVPRIEGGYDIVDGHHRAKASREVGLTDVLAVLWDGTEEMRTAMNIAFNRIRGEQNLAEVAHQMAQLESAGWDLIQLEQTGFTGTEIESLLAAAHPSTEDDDGLDGQHRAPPEEKEEKAPRPFALELLFSTSADLRRVKRALEKAAPTGGELSEGLLRMIDGNDNT